MSGKGWIKSCIVPEPRSCSLNSYTGLLKRPYKMLRMDFYYHASAFLPRSHSTELGPSPFITQSLPAFIILLLHRTASLSCLWNPELPITPHTPLITLPPPIGMPWLSSLLPLPAKCSALPDCCQSGLGLLCPSTDLVSASVTVLIAPGFLLALLTFLLCPQRGWNYHSDSLPPWQRQREQFSHHPNHVIKYWLPP